MASIVAGAFCEKHASGMDDHIKANPELYLQHTIPYLTVRTLQRHEKALHSLETDSRWIKAFVIRVYDAVGNVVETHDHAGDFKEP